MANARPRIAYLVSQHPIVSQTFVVREIRALRARDIDVYVIAVRGPDRPPELLSDVERDEARATAYIIGRGAHALLRAHLTTLCARPHAYLRALWEALDLRHLDVIRTLRGCAYWAEAVVAGDDMRRSGITHVHAHFASHVARFIPRIFPATYSATVHGPTELENPASSGLSARIAAASFICATSRYARSRLLLSSAAGLWSRIETTPLGVDTQRYHPRTRRTRNTHDTLQLLCVARLAEQKGHHVLLAAVDELRRAGLEFHLRLVGDGPLRPSLEAAVRARRLGAHVSFEGACSEQRVRTLYDAADMFVLTSFAEGMPVSLMEAMAMGIPCVATHVGGTAELIRDGIDGVLVPPADPSAVAQALARLAGNEGLRRHFGAAGRRRVLETYEFGACVDQLVRVFRARVFGKEPGPVVTPVAGARRLGAQSAGSQRRVSSASSSIARSLPSNQSAATSGTRTSSTGARRVTPSNASSISAAK